MQIGETTKNMDMTMTDVNVFATASTRYASMWLEYHPRVSLPQTKVEGILRQERGRRDTQMLLFEE